MNDTDLRPSDFTTIDSFPLRWRWTQATHAILPPRALATIHPLTVAAATRLGPVAARLCSEDKFNQPTQSLNTESLMVHDVAAWLGALPVKPDQLVIVSWANDTAVQTQWDTFVAYWDDFCYPSSDDVAVWTPSNEWVLCYRHYERFEFRSRAAA